MSRRFLVPEIIMKFIKYQTSKNSDFTNGGKWLKWIKDLCNSWLCCSFIPGSQAQQIFLYFCPFSLGSVCFRVSNDEGNQSLVSPSTRVVAGGGRGKWPPISTILVTSFFQIQRFPLRWSNMQTLIFLIRGEATRLRSPHYSTEISGLTNSIERNFYTRMKKII